MADLVPTRFVAHIAPLLQNEAEQSAFLDACHRPLPTCFRADPNVVSHDSLRESLAHHDIEIEPLDFLSDAFVATHAKNLGRLLEHRLGFYYVQEAASMIPVEVLRRLTNNPQRIVDFCAAPGSKTTQLASAFRNRPLILANEVAGSRLKALVANLIRCRATNVVCSKVPGEQLGDSFPEHFDAVLLDAPCSGEGCIRKDKQALRGWNKKRKKKLIRTQQDLLQSAWRALSPGGTLVYSTCTLSPEENQLAIEALMSELACDAEVISLADTMPELERSATSEGYLWVAPHHYDTGGFFVAALRKPGTLSLPEDQASLLSECPSDLKALLLEHHGFDVETVEGKIFQDKQTAFLSPLGADELESELKLYRKGVRVAEEDQGTWRLHQEFAVAFGAQFQSGTLEVNRDDARHFLYGGVPESCRDVDSDRELLLRYQGMPLGFVARIDGRVQNRLSRSFIQQSVL